VLRLLCGMVIAGTASPTSCSGCDAGVPRLHRFWDKKNRSLFAEVTALKVADFAVTRANLQNGGRELNPMVRVFGGSTPALAANFAGVTAGVHWHQLPLSQNRPPQTRTDHLMVNIGASSAAITYGLTHG
jgi:hypothetical protein